MNMSKQLLTKEIEDIVTKFPGPITCRASRLKWWVMIVLWGGGTALSVFLASVLYLDPTRAIGEVRLPVAILILCTILCGLCVVVSAMALRTSSLRLDGDGFVVNGLFRKQYRWSEVSDFGVFYGRATAWGAFKSARRPSNILAQVNARLAGGRNDGLPDTYGYGATELVQIMKTWQSLATKASTGVVTGKY